MHTNPEVLAALALDESTGTPEDRGHLARCPVCQGELDQLTRTLGLARALTPDDLRTPDDRVWTRIRAQLWPVRTVSSPVDAEDWRHVTVPAGFGSAAELARANLSARPGWPGAHGTAVVEEGPHRTVRIRMALGSAEHHRPATEAQLAAWLITPDQSAMVRLGQRHGVDDTDLRFDVPAEVDLLRYPVVDLSRQPADDDGTAAHSGDSIVRGVLA